ncbi:hypothetical protein [Sphingorhabdus lacus]|uniref:Uncharacterized protein n=1 Tax=Sphingorhabdus lacus TaxID=392610 RepID=A0A6I6LB25_9SPHN|nr:hypothetical protein [Sphingorhabdus lacus]QGY81768.1 hypothetical protein EUU25_14760 [Sphingorhabdus lacus]
MPISSICSPIEAQDSAELVASILEDAAVRLRMLLTPEQAASAFLEAGVFGMLSTAGYDALLSTVAQSTKSYVDCRHRAKAAN